MLIIETPTFTRKIVELLSDEEYRELQSTLVERPDSGAVIPGAKGLRKLRFSLEGRGQRGGGRIIYYWVVGNEIIYMVYAYRKNEQEDLTPKQLKLLAKQVEEFINEK